MKPWKVRLFPTHGDMLPVRSEATVHITQAWSTYWMQEMNPYISDLARTGCPQLCFSGILFLLCTYYMACHMLIHKISPSKRFLSLAFYISSSPIFYIYFNGWKDIYEQLEKCLGIMGLKGIFVRSHIVCKLMALSLSRKVACPRRPSHWMGSPFYHLRIWLFFVYLFIQQTFIF